MHITWHGQFTIKIQTQDTILVIDPYAPSTGLPAFRARADVIALTNPTDSSMSHLGGIQGEPAMVATPGEYAVKGIRLNALGWHAKDGTERSMHWYRIEGMTLLHVGARVEELTDKELQEIEKTDVDVLFAPVGGGTALTAKQALQLVTTLEPRLTIPIHYRLSGLTEKLESLDGFAKEVGVSPSSAQKKIIVKPRTLPEENMETVILTP